MNDISYVSGVSDVPLLGQTIGHALDRAAERWGDRTALVSPSQDIRWTWDELRARADAFAAGLLALGLQRGDRIGIWSLNRAEWTVTQFAAARAGLILVTINPAYRLSELEFALNKVGCKALVTATGFKSSDYIGMVTTLAPELASSAPGHLSAGRLPQLRTVIQIGGPKVDGTIAFDDLAALGGEAELSTLRALGPELQFDDAINIQFTSGTTGSPKGVTLTHHNILNNGYFVGRALRLTEQDRICIPVPPPAGARDHPRLPLHRRARLRRLRRLFAGEERDRVHARRHRRLSRRLRAGGAGARPRRTTWMPAACSTPSSSPRPGRRRSPGA